MVNFLANSCLITLPAVNGHQHVGVCFCPLGRSNGSTTFTRVNQSNSVAAEQIATLCIFRNTVINKLLSVLSYALQF